MTLAAWYLVVGAVLMFMALTAYHIRYMPLSTAIVYLGAGVVLGPTLFDQFHFNPLDHSAILEIVTELAVTVSLFGAGLKLAAPVGHRIWWTPFRLATISMVLTVLLTAMVGMWLLDLPLGAGILLGAMLAPTDPVLATDVQVRKPGDDHRVRFALTGEAGLNDGTAFPMVMLGLGLLGLHELGTGLSHWWLVDVLWASAAGLAVGGLLGIAAAWAMHRLAERGMQSEFMESFLGLGLLALSYGLALLLHAYGFLAVFAAGFMLHRAEAKLGWSGQPASEDATDGVASKASGDAPYMARVSLHFIEQLERLAEVALLILMGGMLFADSWRLMYVVCAVLLLFVVRPISVFVGLIGTGEPVAAKSTVAWFGVRGIGSFYYLMYAIQHGLPEELSLTLVSLVLVVVVISIVLHGASVTPIMRWYGRSQSS